MKQINNSIKAIVFIAIMILPFQENFAGNEQRAGQAGASELLINPWARSSGWEELKVCFLMLQVWHLLIKQS